VTVFEIFSEAKAVFAAAKEAARYNFTVNDAVVEVFAVFLAT